MPMLSGSGVIGAASGRPDGLYYDAIYAADVKDLRNSAHRVEDMARLREREFNKLVSGEFRGFEGEYFGKTPISVAGYSATSGFGTYLRIDPELLDPKIKSIVTSSATDALDGINLILTISGSVVSRPITKAYYSSITSQYLFYFSDGVDETANVDITAGAIVPFGLGDRSVPTHSAETILHCDIIGDPANYPQDWKDYGVFGTPLLVGENGENLIPDGIGKEYKATRKVLNNLFRLQSSDSGATWNQYTNIIFDGSTNAFTTNLATGSIYMFFYTTKANPTELAANAEVLSLGDAFGSNAAAVNYGGGLSAHMVGKIPVELTPPYAMLRSMEGALLGKASSNLNELLDILEPPRHSIMDLTDPAGGPAVKILPYLSRENGRAYLNLLYKEMKWDTTLDIADEFTQITSVNAGSTSLVAGTYYEVADDAGTSMDGHTWYCVATTGSNFNSTVFTITSQGVMKTDTGVLHLVLWDGNGWGDNNQFTVLDNESTETDDNGNTIIVGQKRVALPNFISDGE